MKFRDTLADMISGGELTRQRALIGGLQKACLVAAEMIDDREARIVTMRVALEKIIMEETPGANATVRRIVRIARAARE